jgi:hypothetical protein
MIRGLVLAALVAGGPVERLTVADHLALGWARMLETFRAPTVKQIILLPAKVQLDTGETSERLCVFVKVSTGRIGLRPQDVGTDCEVLWRYSYVKSTRRLTAAEQALVNATCINWSVGGGTMNPAGCDRVLTTG